MDSRMSERVCGFRTVVLLFAGLLLTACATVDTSDIEVVGKASPDARFDSYRSYAWLDTAQIVNDPLGKWEPPGFDADAAVMALVDRELSAKGLLLASSTPDLLVTFVAGIDMAALELREDPEKEQQTLQNIPRGALVVILADAESRRPAWVGVARADVQRSLEPEVIHKRLDYVITEMFRQYPGN
jgi:hypothetical protein